MCNPRHPDRAPLRARRTQRGVMLLEVLVSILIFSIGVLALVGLQARMTTAQSESKYRADAGYLAQELMGVMWGDLGNLANYNGVTCAGYVRCSEWQTKVTNNLPNGTGAVTLNAANQEVTVTITWQHGSEPQRTYTTRSRLNAAS